MLWVFMTCYKQYHIGAQTNVNHTGTQRIISFLRQMVEHGGFYRANDQAWVKFERIQFVGACNPPTDPGRKPLSHRCTLSSPSLHPSHHSIISTTFYLCILFTTLHSTSTGSCDTCLWSTWTTLAGCPCARSTVPSTGPCCVSFPLSRRTQNLSPMPWWNFSFSPRCSCFPFYPSSLLHSFSFFLLPIFLLHQSYSAPSIHSFILSCFSIHSFHFVFPSIHSFFSLHPSILFCFSTLSSITSLHALEPMIHNVHRLLHLQTRFTHDMQPHYIYSPREMTRFV